MLRPAASQWTCLAHRTSSTALRPSSIAARRCINITSTNSSTEPTINPSTAPIPSPDARFEVIGTPFSLLSVSLSASQTLYTRRGTLVGLSGKSENTVSTLSFLEPFRRAPVGIPFLYQKISSTSPITALISTKSPISSIVTVQLDGRHDWVISQRQALLAWTGLTLNLRPQYNVKLGLAHWGNTYVTGRGLLGLAGSGQIYQVQLKAGESYVAHPGNVVAYTASTTPPLPFRFKSSSLRFQVPDLGFTSLLQNIKFYRVMSETAAWRTMGTAVHTLKTWLWRSIWGDRLFLRFEGPSTLLLASRASRVSDVLSTRDINEIAASPPGAIQDAVAKKIQEEIKDISGSATAPTTPIASQDSAEAGHVRFVNVKEGKVEVEAEKVKVEGKVDGKV